MTARVTDLAINVTRDVYEQVPAEGLERAARFHAYFVERADQAPEALIAAGKGTPYESREPRCP